MLAGAALGALLSFSATAYASCPEPYASADCYDGGSYAVCEVSGTELTCDNNRIGSSGSYMFAIYDPAHDVCDDEYCFFGNDAAFEYFCCEFDASGFNAITIHGGDTMDRVQLHYTTDTEVYFLDDYGASQGFPVRIYGYAGDDSMSGSDATSASYVEYFYGAGGEDSYLGGDANSWAYGEDGDDDLRGYVGNDHIFGGDGDDFIMGVQGNDILHGDGGNDDIDGGQDDDEVYGGPGNDNVDGGDGADSVYGQEGSDTVEGDDGADQVYGGGGDDYVCGGDDVDYNFGETGNDQLWDSSSADYENGGAGTDTCEDTPAFRSACETVVNYAYPCW